MVKSYKDLEVHKRAYSLALIIHQTSLDFPKVEQFGGVADQLRRATKSINLNIAEGYGRKSALEFKRYLKMSLGSNNEVLVLLDFCKDLGYISNDNHANLTNNYNQVGKMLYKLIEIWK